MQKESSFRYVPLGTVIVGALLLAILILQEQGMLSFKQSLGVHSAKQSLQHVHSWILGPRETGPGRIVDPCNSSSESGGAAAAAAGASTFRMPSMVGSCIQNTTSSFPYVGHDIFMDFAHAVFVPGRSLSFKGPSIVFLHPQDAPAFAAVVPKLQQRVVLVSNSNIDQCLPWSHGNNIDSWRPHIDVILNSSIVASWWVLLGVHGRHTVHECDCVVQLLLYNASTAC
jgi:hypothetical protein